MEFEFITEVREVGIDSFHWPTAMASECWHQAYILFYVAY